MQNSIWKLTALAGVIGATCLAVFLIQRGADNQPVILPAAKDSDDQASDSESPSSQPHTLLSDEETDRVLNADPQEVAALAMFDSEQSEPNSVTDHETSPESIPLDPPSDGGLDFNSGVDLTEDNATPPAEDLFDFGPAGVPDTRAANAAFDSEMRNRPTESDIIPTAAQEPISSGEAPELLFVDDARPADETDPFENRAAPSRTTATNAGPALIGGNSVPVPDEILNDAPIRQTSEATEEPFNLFADEAETNPPKKDTSGDSMPPDDAGELFDPLEATDSAVAPPADPAVPETRDNPGSGDFPPLDGFEFAPEEPAGDTSPAQPSPRAAELLDEAIDTGIPSQPTEQPRLDENPFGSGDPFDLDALDKGTPAEAAGDVTADPQVEAGSSVPVPDTLGGSTGSELPEFPIEPTQEPVPPSTGSGPDLDLFPPLESAEPVTDPARSTPEPESAEPPSDPLEGFDAIEETIRKRSTAPVEPTEPSDEQPGSPRPATDDFPALPRIDSTEPAPLSPSPELAPIPANDPREAAGADLEGSIDAPADSTRPAAEPRPDRPLVGDAVIDRPMAQRALRPQLRIEKSAPATATLGQPFIYHILITNAGQTPARDVVVEDRIPKGTELTGTIPRAELDGTTLIWKLGEMPPGAASRISIRVVPKAPGSIGSIATVRSAAEVAAETNVTVPTLSFTLTSNQQVRLGEKAVFRFTVQNAGPGIASDVMIRNVIPEGLSHPDGNDLEYEVGTLQPGESKSVRLSLDTKQAGMLTNKAEVIANGGIKVTASARVEVIGNQLTLSRTGPARRFVGRAAEFENHVKNESDRPVARAQIIERIPEGMEFVEASAGARFDEVQRIVFWELDDLAPQQSAVLKVKLVPRNTGIQKSVVEVLEPTGNKSRTVSETEVSGYASLGLDVSEVDRPMAVGERLVLTVRARNRGTSPAKQVDLSILVPAELEVLGVKANNQAVEFVRTENGVKLPSLESLAGQQSADYEVVLLARGHAATRVRVQIDAEELSAPITRDEAILIVPDN